MQSLRARGSRKLYSQFYVLPGRLDVQAPRQQAVQVSSTEVEDGPEAELSLFDNPSRSRLWPISIELTRSPASAKWR